ncbi:MAG: hypothetical protein HC876_18955 [Chloroflexaceae bacterium]|nr:hypothetical protein [Chloroflexaceae bacterium]NJO07417.1 hypothetical protein [Chloroflexaceae bacterium]
MPEHPENGDASITDESANMGSGSRNLHRSEHSQQRAQEGRRTEPAFTDAAVVVRGRIAWDEQTGRLIMRGPRGRYHLFESDGEHVTTVDYTAEVWERRHRSGRWHVLMDEEWEQFQNVFQQG